MNRHFLFYWSPDTVRYELERGTPIRWAASNQFKRLAPEGGETLWIVTCFLNRLIYVACLPVDKVVEWEKAVDILGTDDIWEANHVAIADEAHAFPPVEIDITELASDLRFRSDRDRLRLQTGRVDPQQLQTMRELTPESVLLLTKRLKTDR